MRSKVNWSALSFCASADIFSCFERRYPTYIVMNLRSGVFFVNDVPTFAVGLGLEAESRKDFSGMVLGLRFQNDRSDGAVFIDEKGCAVRAFVFLSHEFFESPHPECFVEAQVFIAREVKSDAVLIDELQVLRSGIGAHAEHFDARLAEAVVVLSQIARLRCAAGRHVPRIEIEREFLAGIISEGARASVLKGCFKSGGRGSCGQGVGCHWHTQITVLFPSSSLVPLHNSSQFANP